MKYPIIISFFVISIVFSTQLVDSIADDYFLTQHRPLFGYRTGPSSVTGNQVLDNLARYNESNLNNTFYGYVDPTQQPGTTGIFVWIDQWIKSLSGINLIFSTLYYCSFGFGQYINNLFFMPLGGRLLLSPFFVNFIGTCIGIIQMLTVFGFIRGMQIGD
jgi:hypothetical protein